MIGRKVLIERLFTGMPLFLGISLVAQVTWAQGGGLDTVQRAKGPALLGSVVGTSATHIEIQVKDRREKVSVFEVTRLMLAEDPPRLRRARDLVQQDQYENALKELVALQSTEVTRDLVLEDIEYYRLYCEGRLALRTGENQKVRQEALLAFATSHRDSRHFYQAAELLGDLATARGAPAEATKFYRSLAKADWPPLTMKSAVLIGVSLQSESKWSDAAKQFDQVMNDSLATPDAERYKIRARVGKAYCQAYLDDPAGGIQSLEGLVAQQDPQDAESFSRIYNALGTCYRKANRPQDAILAFLHVEILFPNQAEARAEALFHLGQLWSEVRQEERATQARNQLKTQYSGSRWARQ